MKPDKNIKKKIMFLSDKAYSYEKKQLAKGLVKYKDKWVAKGKVSRDKKSSLKSKLTKEKNSSPPKLQKDLSLFATTFSPPLAPKEYFPDPIVTAKLKTGLGVKRQIVIWRTWIEGSDLLTYLSKVNIYTGATWDFDNIYKKHGGRDKYVYLRKAVFQRTDGIFLIIPWNLIKQTKSANNFHVIKLKDNSEHYGKLLNRIQDKKEKEYDLATSSLSIISVTSGPGPNTKEQHMKDYMKKQNSKKNKNSPLTWNLTLAGQTQKYKVTYPRFEILFSYQTWKIKYPFKERVTEMAHESMKSFFLIVNNKETQGLISDFKNIIFHTNKMTVTALDSKPIHGNFVLYGKYNGKRRKVKTWVFACDFPSGYTMIIPKPNCQIVKSMD